jgi:hypothetical protein
LVFDQRAGIRNKVIEEAIGGGDNGNGGGLLFHRIFMVFL